MTFTTFDLSTAEFPDATVPGSYSGGALIPDFPSSGLVFWLPGMTRDLSLWYTIVVDFEVTGDFPYTQRPEGNAFQWRNDGDYGSSSGSTIASGDTGLKPVKSLVFQVGPGGDVDEERVAFFMFGNVPPVTGVRWQESTAIPTGGDFSTPQAAGFGQTYSIDWDTQPDPSAENTALGTPDVVASAWFTFTLPAAGLVQINGSPGQQVYQGSSLGSLTPVGDGTTVEALVAGSYYLRTFTTSGGFTSFVSLVGYQAETIYGPWISPSPVDVDFTLGSDGSTDDPTSLGLSYITQQRADTGSSPGVGLWWEDVELSHTSAAPIFDASRVAVAIGRAESGGTLLDSTTPFAGQAEWRIENSHFDDSPGHTGGSRTYRAAERRTSWFLSLKAPITPVPDSLAAGWQNEDGSSDTAQDSIASSGALSATFQHTNTTADGAGWTIGSWASHFATVEGATLNLSGNVDYDQITHPGAVDLFVFAVDSDNLTETQTATITLPGDDLFGFVQWTTPPDVGDNKTGDLGTYLSDGTFTVTYDVPDYRSRFEGIEVLLPLVGDVVGPIPPLRVFPRSDGLGASSVMRVYPPSRSIQFSNRRGPAAYL